MIFQKILNLKRLKKSVTDIKTKADAFIELHKGNIKVLMNILQVLYDRTEGKKKMLQCVLIICSAMGLEDYSEEILNFIQEKLQEIYNELVAQGCLK